MDHPDNKTFSILALIGLIASLIGLFVDIPQVGQIPYGIPILYIIFISALVYIAYIVYKKFHQIYFERIKNFENIKAMIMNFILSNNSATITTQIDTELINLIVATKHMSHIPLKVNELSLSNGTIQIIIDKGDIHGLKENMQFKIFHKDQLIEIGTCGCTLAYDQATLVFPISSECPLSQSDIRKEKLEIRLVEPPDDGRINKLLANMLYELDRQ